MPDIFSILDDLGRNVAALRESLSPLRALVGNDGLSPMVVRTTRKRGRPRKARRPAARKPATQKSKTAQRPRRKISPKGRAALKMAGRYMGLVRNLTAAQKAQVKKVHEEKGIDAAIRLAASIRSE